MRQSFPTVVSGWKPDNYMNPHCRVTLTLITGPINNHIKQVLGSFLTNMSLAVILTPPHPLRTRFVPPGSKKTPGRVIKVKETVSNLVSYNRTGFLQTIGGALIRGGAINWQITVSTSSWRFWDTYSRKLSHRIGFISLAWDTALGSLYKLAPGPGQCYGILPLFHMDFLKLNPGKRWFNFTHSPGEYRGNINAPG